MQLVPKLAIVAGLLALAAACAPRVVTDISLTGDQAKLVYARNSPFAADTGIVQCTRQPDGSLTDCRQIPITFRKKGE
jgi:hypothetical protein